MKETLFIEPKTLKSKINKPNVKILDATFFLPDSGLNAEEEYQKEHIPNSVFFDINKIADPKNPLPHMIPSKDLFFNPEIGEKQSHIAKKFGDFGYSLWDASGRNTRAVMPDHLDVMRFVNYQSSRGLEGWSVFCHGFDDFWNEMLEKGAEAFDLASNLRYKTA